MRLVIAIFLMDGELNKGVVMDNVLAQECIEETYSRKHIDKKIKTSILNNSLMQKKITKGMLLVMEYVTNTYTYESKNRRIAQLQNMDIEAMVIDIFVGIAYFQRPELFTSASSQIATRLKLSDRVEAITCTAEILAILCNTDAFDIDKKSKMASLTLVSRIPLEEELIKFIERSQYLPPMLCKPLSLKHNYSSGYLTHNDSLILGSGNHHDGDLCLDVLNTISSVALKIDNTFILNVPELPTFELDTPEKETEWEHFKRDSQHFYCLMIQQGNKFYLNHKVDKRGRVYASGYHISTEGTPYKKAMLEFHKQEIVEGVP